MAIYKDERGDTVSTAETDKVVQVSSAEARQGPPGVPVLKVLIGGLVLVAIAWGIANLYGETIDNDPATEVQQTTTTPPDVTGTPPAGDVVDNTPPAGETLQSAPADQDPTPSTGTGQTP